MRKAAEEIHAIVLLSQEFKGIDPKVTVDFLKVVHHGKMVYADIKLFELAGLFSQDPAPRGADDSGKERDSEKP
jgi:hypothetical protein